MALFFAIDTAPEVAYELIAEPVQEPPAEGQQQEEAIEPAPEEVANPADLQGKPRSIFLTFKLCLVIYEVLCIYIQGIDWNHRCIISFTQCLISYWIDSTALLN